MYSKYDSSLTYSYVFGAFGTIKLLNEKRNYCQAVLIDPSFCENETFKKIKDLCGKDIPIIIDKYQIEKIRDKGNIYVIGVFSKYENILDESNHLVICNIDSPGTIGTIIRSMQGFNYKNLILVNCDVDIFNEHLVRSTMGSYFSCNIVKYDNLDKYLNSFSNYSFYNITNNGDSLTSIDTSKKISLIINGKCNPNRAINIKFDKDLSIDNIVNIILFSLYK